jgi:hypothetical protein
MLCFPLISLVAVQMPKETKQMKKALALMICVLLVSASFAQTQMGGMRGMGGGQRGKAELKIASGSITIDYGRPPLNGQDRVSQLQPGMFWRMGNNQATVLTTPADLTFGSTKVPKGAYSLWLKTTEAGKYELVFNSQTGQWGTTHDPAKDFASAPMKTEKLPSSVDIFTMDLKSTTGGGVLSLSWGTSLLTAEFKVAQ